MPISSMYFCQRDKNEYFNLVTIGNPDALANSSGAKIKSVILSYGVVFTSMTFLTEIIKTRPNIKF